MGAGTAISNKKSAILVGRAGAADVAGIFSRGARAARLALVNGVAGAAWTVRGPPWVSVAFTITVSRITGTDMLGDPGRPDPAFVRG
jgi:hypothetical protein